MKLSAILAPMLAAKADHSLIEQVIIAYEAQQTDALERRREHERARQARKRGMSRDVTGSPRDRLLVRAVEDITLTSEIEPQESKKASRTQGDVDAFRAGLAPDVSEEVIEEFIKVRRKKRAALTGFAAQLFRGDAAKCSMSVAAAAVECVRSSWITVKPEYFSNRPRAGPAPKPNPGLDVVNALMEKCDVVSPSQTDPNPPYPRLVAFTGSG